MSATALPPATRILIEAARRIANPERWTQGMGARSSDGMCCHPHAPTAVSWCAAGSLNALAWTAATSDAWLLLHLSAQRLGYRPIPPHNDIVNCNDDHDPAGPGADHRRVMRLYALAIKASLGQRKLS